MHPDTDENIAVKIGFAETFTGIITSPAATMREISSSNVLYLAVTAFILAMLASNASTVLTEPEFVQFLGGQAPALAALTAFSLFYLAGKSGLSYILARLFGCRGSFTTLLSLFALANVPSIFNAPLALTRLMPDPAGAMLHGLGSFFLAVWIIALGVLAVREAFQVSTGRAVIIFFLPLFLLLALVAVLVLAALLP